MNTERASIIQLHPSSIPLIGRLESMPANNRRETSSVTRRADVGTEDHSSSHSHSCPALLDKLHTERLLGEFEPRTLLLWSDGANYHSIMPPIIPFCKRVGLGAVGKRFAHSTFLSNSSWWMTYWLYNLQGYFFFSGLRCARLKHSTATSSRPKTTCSLSGILTTWTTSLSSCPSFYFEALNSEHSAVSSIYVIHWWYVSVRIYYADSQCFDCPSKPPEVAHYLWACEGPACNCNLQVVKAKRHVLCTLHKMSGRSPWQLFVCF